MVDRVRHATTALALVDGGCSDVGRGRPPAWSTYLPWLPCRSTSLGASVLRGYRYGPDFSDACLWRMDASLPFPYPPEPVEQAPWASELGVLAMALAGLAWISLVLGMPSSAVATSAAFSWWCGAPPPSESATGSPSTRS